MLLTPNNQFQVAALAAGSYLLLHGKLHNRGYTDRRIGIRPYERVIPYDYSFELRGLVTWDEVTRHGNREMVCENNGQLFTWSSNSAAYVLLRDEGCREDFAFSFHSEQRLLIENYSAKHARAVYAEFFNNEYTIQLHDFDGRPLYFEYVR